MEKKRICGPAGWGDLSWLWSKLVNVKDEIDEILIADGWPYRSREYMELCGIRSSYADGKEDRELVDYRMILQGMKMRNWSADTGGMPTWEEIRKRGDRLILLEPNRHLELGRPLAEWMPDLPTEFHYPLHTTQNHAIRAKWLLDDYSLPRHPMKEGPVVGISCASYRGAEAWKTWAREDWVAFLKKIMAFGWRPLIIGGSWDDLSFAVACELEIPDLVGKTNAGECIELLKLLDGYIGFSSGLNVVRTVLNKPALAWWPDFQKELSTAWAPPDMLMSDRYIAFPYRRVEDAWPVAKHFLKVCEVELSNGRDHHHAREEAAEAEKAQEA